MGKHQKCPQPGLVFRFSWIVLVTHPFSTALKSRSNVTFADAEISSAIGASYDGVTSALRVNADLHATLICVEDVFDLASGDLSLPGVIK